jgi:hypothetical protein
VCRLERLFKAERGRLLPRRAMAQGNAS